MIDVYAGHLRVQDLTYLLRAHIMAISLKRWDRCVPDAALRCDHRAKIVLYGA